MARRHVLVEHVEHFEHLEHLGQGLKLPSATGSRKSSGACEDGKEAGKRTPDWQALVAPPSPSKPWVVSSLKFCCLEKLGSVQAWNEKLQPCPTFTGLFFNCSDRPRNPQLLETSALPNPIQYLPWILCNLSFVFCQKLGGHLQFFVKRFVRTPRWTGTCCALRMGP